MIGVKRVKEFPYHLELCGIASKEMALNAETVEYVMDRSCAWIISKNGIPLFMIGILKLSLVGGPSRIWFVGFDGFERYLVSTMKFLKRALRHTRRVRGELSVVVDMGCSRSKNFAYALGFVPTNHIIRENNLAYRYCVLR